MSPTESFSETNWTFRPLFQWSHCGSQVELVFPPCFPGHQGKIHTEMCCCGEILGIAHQIAQIFFPASPVYRHCGDQATQESRGRNERKFRGGTRDFSLFLVFTIQWLAHFDHAQNQLQTNYGSPRFPQTYWKLVCRAKKQKSRVFLASQFMTWHACGKKRESQLWLSIITCIYCILPLQSLQKGS